MLSVLLHGTDVWAQAGEGLPLRCGTLRTAINQVVVRVRDLKISWTPQIRAPHNDCAGLRPRHLKVHRSTSCGRPLPWSAPE